MAVGAVLGTWAVSDCSIAVEPRRCSCWSERGIGRDLLAQFSFLSSSFLSSGHKYLYRL